MDAQLLLAILGVCFIEVIAFVFIAHSLYKRRQLGKLVKQFFDDKERWDEMIKDGETVACVEGGENANFV